MDHISNLPDDVLCHILSYLTTKEAALTSILAKRWRNLLAFVPCLNIDDSVFLYPEEGKRERAHIKQRFINFVDRVLALQGNCPLKKCSLKCVTVVYTDRVDGWISNVLARGVSDLDLYVTTTIRSYRVGYYKLPPKCFKCSTLVKLKIYGGIDVTLVAGRIFLPLLKTLVLLDWVMVYSNGFKTMLHALPSLEELVLVDVIWKGGDVTVSSASLKTLTMKLDYTINTLSFDTPSLLHFKYSSYVAWDYPVVSMGNLVDAQILFCLSEGYIKLPTEPDNDEDALRYSNVWKLFHGIRNVPQLSLLPDTLEVLSICSESSMPVFNNLKSLTIKSDKDRGWQAMPALLRNSPHLETLVIQGLVHHVTDKCGDVCDCISREDKGLSLKLCPVKVMKIHGFQGTVEEMAMIKHFLEYFPSLKEMLVYAAEEDNNHTQPGDHEVPKPVLEIFELYNKLSCCNVQLFI